jgi:DNA-binding FadR family transcriptional regulator
MFDTDVLKWILSSKPSLSLLKEFTQVRVALEPQAAALAAMNASDEQIAAIEKALDRMVEAEQGLDDPLEADIAFHTSILVASGNRFFVQLTEFISTALRVSIRYTNKIKGVPGADVKKHAEIFNAIKARNPQQTRAAVSMILDEALELIESKL